jgi:hypothetical protein
MGCIVGLKRRRSLYVGLRKENPDTFCLRLFPDVQPEFIEGARLHRASLQRPSFDPGQGLHKSLLLQRITRGIDPSDRRLVSGL